MPFDPEDARNLEIMLKTPYTWITEIAIKRHYQIVPEILNISVVQANPQFECTIKMLIPGAEAVTASAIGKNKQSAKQKAAICMLNALEIGETEMLEFLSVPNKAGELSKGALKVLHPEDKKEEDKNAPPLPLASVGRADGKNYVGDLKVICCTYCLESPLYSLVRVDGPSHSPEVTMSGKVFARGKLMGADVEAIVSAVGKRSDVKQLVAKQLLEQVTAKLEQIFKSVKAWGELCPENKDLLSIYPLYDENEKDDSGIGPQELDLSNEDVAALSISSKSTEN